MEINQELMQKVGLKEAVILTAIINKSEKENIFFPYPKEDIRKEFNLSRCELDTIIKNLTLCKLIEVKLIGIPRITNFKILK